MNSGPWLSDLRTPIGKKARLQRIGCRSVLGDDTAMFGPCQQDKSRRRFTEIADIARRYPSRRNESW